MAVTIERESRGVKQAGKCRLATGELPAIDEGKRKATGANHGE